MDRRRRVGARIQILSGCGRDDGRSGGRQKISAAVLLASAVGQKNGVNPFATITVMRIPVLLLMATALFAEQPILYHRGAVNAASLAPFGLPNAPIARGSIFTISGENLGPAQSQTVSSFPLATTFGGVSLSVTQGGVATQAYPLTISATKIYAVMPSSVTAGLATLRLTYQNVRSNAIPIQIADSA